ncbi:MAG: isocitrate/isopropylmalate family dehydrogenase [Hyphomicrobiaceae bacterium]|nr:isocitrate/isopropylmalate family dehydrogenase [Hyphomicrobiaceae bacterium]
MAGSNAFQIAVLPGDGIGPEVMAPCLEVLAEAERRVGGFSLSTRALPAGAGHLRDHGEALPETTLEACRAADAILLAAMGLPDVRYPDGTEATPQIDLRTRLGLYAGVRPVRCLPGFPRVLADPRAADLDFVLVRESTEGLFATRGKGAVVDDKVAVETLVITRDTSERLFDFCFRLARQRQARGRPGRVTCVDKANVFSAFAFFRRIFYERAAGFPDIAASHAYVDAVALDMVRRPWELDVLVTENMFGDILSDLGAGLMGGMGLAPSADIGDAHAVFQPCHGTAPDIVGQGKANPTAMILSGAMMLEWLAASRGSAAAGQAARLVDAAVGKAYLEAGLKPFELGGRDGTAAIANAVLKAVRELPLE